MHIGLIIAITGVSFNLFLLYTALDKISRTLESIDHTLKETR